MEQADPKGNEEKFAILGVSPNVMIFRDKALCDVPGAPDTQTELDSSFSYLIGENDVGSMLLSNFLGAYSTINLPVPL